MNLELECPVGATVSALRVLACILFDGALARGPRRCDGVPVAATRGQDRSMRRRARAPHPAGSGAAEPYPFVVTGRTAVRHYELQRPRRLGTNTYQFHVLSSEVRSEVIVFS